MGEKAPPGSLCDRIAREVERLGYRAEYAHGTVTA